MKLCLLFEFDCSRRFTRDIIEYPVHMAHFIDDPAGNCLQHLIWYLYNICCHEIDCIHGAETVFPIPLALACSFNPDMAEQTAKANINQYTDQEIARAKREIGNQVASVVSKADSTLTRQFNAVAQSLNTEAEKTKKELSGKISGIEDNITKAKAISFMYSSNNFIRRLYC